MLHFSSWTSAFIVTLIITASIAGCSDYNKVLKSTDLDYKYQRALGYLDSNKCYAALPILEEVVSLTRGTEQAKDVQFYYAETHRCVGDYYLARYYFKMFTKTFPNDIRSEQAQFEAAICSYKLSPKAALDQTETTAAIEEFQLFMDRYPGSALRDSSQQLINFLHDKLEVKSFETSSLYHKTSQYKSAVIALKNALKEFPDSPFREEIQWLILDSHFKYAQQSTERRKMERYNDTIEAFLTFVARFPEGEHMIEAQRTYDQCTRAVESLQSNQTFE
ncbi:MAG: outer membrane protein assembly factor BamD [Flavobacteriales bacterium]